MEFSQGQGKLAVTGADLGGGSRGFAPPLPEMTCGFLIQLVFCKKKKTMWFITVEVQQETSAPPPKKILDPPLRNIEVSVLSGCQRLLFYLE